ncbi:MULTISPECIES: DUF5988 family protein [Streptomyces]|uniref:DUF5988 family protein n=1 Tax=Streptomyces TaxID=1883 RepID=UPI0004CD38E2|nr:MULTISPECIES: DUF5988 family protein [Streptomyces]
MPHTTEALLEGGPDHLAGRRTVPQDDHGTDLKIPYLNRYEHYAFAGTRQDTDGATVPVFRWTHHTFLAE